MRNIEAARRRAVPRKSTRRIVLREKTFNKDDDFAFEEAISGKFDGIVKVKVRMAMKAAGILEAIS